VIFEEKKKVKNAKVSSCESFCS